MSSVKEDALAIQAALAAVTLQAAALVARAGAVHSAVTGQTATSPIPSEPVPPPTISPGPPPVPASPPQPPGVVISHVYATDFGNSEDEPRNWRQMAYSSTWGPKCSPGSGKTTPGCALPAIVKQGTFVWVRYNGGAWLAVPVVDVGPWNTHDDYWDTNTRPEAETGTDRQGRETNHAGIDFTPETWSELTGKTPEACWEGSLDGYVDIIVCPPGTPFPLTSVSPQIATTINSSIVSRARSIAGNPAIWYNQDMQADGDNPTSLLPGSILNGKRVCDCSLFVAWVLRYVRGDRWNTSGIYQDAIGQQTKFRRVTGVAKPGMAYVYEATASHPEGHTGIITEIDTNGVPTKVVHCHGPTGGPAPAIQETAPTVFTAQNAIIVEYIG